MPQKSDSLRCLCESHTALLNARRLGAHVDDRIDQIRRDIVLKKREIARYKQAAAENADGNGLSASSVRLLSGTSVMDVVDKVVDATLW